MQYDHPDLVANYRGNNGDGTFTNDYNFYDPSGTCATSITPCDNSGHGTHTMGTMVAKNGIGVAPNAKWIAAKGCESFQNCWEADLLAAGQWILAPTDHNGQNPRPDLAPNIVNNSWGGGQTAFYQDIVEAWNSAGIFEAFAAGNDGDGKTCSTTAAPSAQDTSYGVGAYDSTGKIASFSGFGPSPVDGSAKPNISAPGVNVRSTWPGSTYKVENGTSMATPHVAGAVGLLWSAAPSLIGNIDETRTLLNEGARDVDDTHCGGTAGMNNVWGEASSTSSPPSTRPRTPPSP
ncbi:S8 family serine peptidase [Streptomyces sp. NBC_00056]|uniref:S8 family serine peptidase n=1 Tax=Streptomyces sp. NBC_00056 TaxID=2975633 RepID=UPI00324BD363